MSSCCDRCTSTPGASPDIATPTWAHREVWDCWFSPLHHCTAICLVMHTNKYATGWQIRWSSVQWSSYWCSALHAACSTSRAGSQSMHDIDEQDHSAWKLSLSCGAETFSSVDPACTLGTRLLTPRLSFYQLTGELQVSSAGMVRSCCNRELRTGNWVPAKLLLEKPGKFYLCSSFNI